MAGFQDAWAAVDRPRGGEFVSPELRPLLDLVYHSILTDPLDLTSLKASLEELLEYLSHGGRSNANCWATDLFFGESQGWERDWTDQNLPDEYHDVLAMMGEALHDTVKAPDVAKDFDCLPEQLLERVRRLSLG